jgi:hypothetical protein
MQGQALPINLERRRPGVITPFDSQFAAVGMHLQTIYRDGLLCTTCGPTPRAQAAL